jgi:mannosyltransferase
MWPRRSGPLLVAAAAATMGSCRLGHQGLWTDEAFSIATARLDLSTMLRVAVTGDSFAGLYNGLLHLWAQWGDGDAWFRFPSVVFGVLAVVTLFVLNRRLLGIQTALLATVFLLLNSYFVRYEQEARPYALAVFLVVLATYSFVLALDRPSTRRFVIYGAVCAVAIYAHFFAVFVVAAHILSLALRDPRPSARQLGAAFGVMVGLVSPLMAIILTTNQVRRAFIPKPSLHSFQWLFLHLTGGGGVESRNAHLLLLLYFLLCCTALVGMLGDFARRRNRRSEMWPHGLMLSWLIVPVGASYIASYAIPMFYPRYLIVALPPLVTIAAFGARKLGHRVLSVAACAVVVVAATPELLFYYQSPVREGEDWRGAAAYVLRNKHPGDRILFLSRYGRRPFEEYLTRSNGQEGLVVVYPGVEWGAYTPILADLEVESTPAAAARLSTARRTWAVLSWGGFDNTNQDTRAFSTTLEMDFKEATREQFGPRVEVRLYERRIRPAPGDLLDAPVAQLHRQ